MSISNAYGGNDIAVKISDSAATRFRFLTGDTTNTTNVDTVMKLATGETTPPLGILQNTTTAANEVATVRIDGTSKLEVDGSGTAIDINTELVATTAGVGVSISTPDATQQFVGAIALEPSAASGDIIRVKVIGPVRVVKGTA